MSETVTMEGYDRSTYGDTFADVYDDWYQGVSSVDDSVNTLLGLCGAGAVLELGVGTGRLAVPLARAGRSRGVSVTGIDASAAMLQRLADRDPDGLVTALSGDMIDDLPRGPFDLVFVAYNTLFNIISEDGHARCFEAVAHRLAAGGRFVVEAFVPDEPFRSGDDVSIRTMSTDRVVLSVSRHDPRRQTAEGQFVELVDGGAVRLRPWAIRYATVAQLDTMAADHGFALESRWGSFARDPFHDDSDRHVSVYRRHP